MKLKRYILNSINKMLASMVMCFLLVAMAGGFIKNDFGLILLQLFQMVIFLGLPYINLKRIGQQEHELVKNGDRAEDLLKGVKIGMVCLAVLEVSVLILLFMKLGILPDRMYIYKLLNPQFVGFVWFLAPTTSVTAISFERLFCIAILPFLYPLTMEVGYLAGYRDKSWV